MTVYKVHSCQKFRWIIFAPSGAGKPTWSPAITQSVPLLWRRASGQLGRQATMNVGFNLIRGEKCCWYARWNSLSAWKTSSVPPGNPALPLWTLYLVTLAESTQARAFNTICCHFVLSILSAIWAVDLVSWIALEWIVITNIFWYFLPALGIAPVSGVLNENHATVATQAETKFWKTQLCLFI